MSGIVPHALRRLRELFGQDGREAVADMESMRRTFDSLMRLFPEPRRVEAMLDRPTIVWADEYHRGLELWPDPAGELLRQWRIELDDEDIAA